MENIPIENILIVYMDKMTIDSLSPIKFTPIKIPTPDKRRAVTMDRHLDSILSKTFLKHYFSEKT